MISPSSLPDVASAETGHVAGYRLQPVRLRFGDARLDVMVVADLQEHVDAAELLRNEEAPEPPYWAHLWPGSRVLARLLLAEASLTGRRIVDLGCGIGLAAVAAARSGAIVVAIDTAAEALRVTDINARRNRCRIDLLQTDVRRPGLRGQFDLCVAADVTYDPALQDAVADFLALHLRPGGDAWCAESVRTLDSGFSAACRAHGMFVREREETEEDEGRPLRVRVTQVHKPGRRS